MQFATAADVEARWRPLSRAESQLAQVLIEDASDLILSRWSDIPTRITTGALALTTLRRIVCGMVKRAMINRDNEGIASQSESAGPFSQNVTLSNPGGNLYLTAENVRAPNGSARRGAFSVDLSSGALPVEYFR